ncbi:MAG: HNH endonuclease signature motif containing protein [Dermatophilaceae bacterium]
MQGMTMDQVRATDVADLAASLLGLSDVELLRADAESAEAMVAAAQRVISAMTAVQAVAIEAWGRRECEQLRVDKVAWRAMSAAAGLATSGGVNGARLRLLDGVPKDEHDFMPSYLAPVLRLSPRSARRRYETARTLAGLLPRTLAAMRAGDLEPHRAQQVVDEVPTNDPDVCAAVEHALFPRIVDKPTTRVGQLARQAVAAADPVAVAQKAEQAHKGRFVFAGPSGLPGLMRFEAEVEAGKGRLVWAAIEELATDYLKDDVAATMDQARADAFVDLVLANAAVTTVVDLALPAGFASGGAARASSCSHCGGGSVLEDAATGTLVDADQHSADRHSADRHSADQHSADRHSADQHSADRHIAGRDSDNEADTHAGRGNVLRLLTGLPTTAVLDHRVGTLTPATIEAILADPDTVFRRLVVDPDTGWLLDAGATTYQPGRHLARAVRKRDLHCRFPGCATAARFCDLDHVIPFPVGLTVLRNMACLCRRHHRLKTHGHWSLTMSPDGICTWIDRRTGQVHTTEPADYRELAV